MRHVLVLWMLLLPALGLANTDPERTVPCPVCETPVTIRMLLSSTRYGQTRDFQPLTAGAYLSIQLGACPKCFYAEYAEDFAKPVPAELRQQILAGALKPPEDLDKGP